MNISQKLQFNNNDKYLKVKLEQNVDTLEFLSMRVTTKNIYEFFNADYGVLVGKVIANEGVGIPNAKISIFIPLDEVDENNGDIYSIYPYKSPRDKNNDGKRYNLLPRVSQYIEEEGIYKPKQPFGSFPTKPEIVTNIKFLDVYRKYYKYSTITNEYGDYMIFGAPIGLQTTHMSLDITDIGKYSMSPAAMVTNLGYSPNFFTENNTKIKPNNDLNDLPHIETQEISVDIIPFWGDDENFEIGITRQDFRIRAQLINTFIIFGSVFTDGLNHMWGQKNDNRYNDLYYRRNPSNQPIHLSMESKRIGIVTENIYYYPASISDDDINSGNVDDDGNDMVLLDPSEYSVYKRDGDFAFIINCNRRKIITSETGQEIVVPDSNPAGIHTQFRGFVTLEITTDSLPLDFSSEVGTRPLTPLRYRIKIPQYAEKEESFAIFNPNQNAALSNTIKWRKQNYTFSADKIYSVSKFHGLVYNDDDSNPPFQFYVQGFLNSDYSPVGGINKLNTNSQNRHEYNTGLIFSDYDAIDDTGNTVTVSELPSNGIVNIITSLPPSVTSKNAFGANWLNLTVHLPQVGKLNPIVDHGSLSNIKSTSNFSLDFKRSNSATFPTNQNYFNNNSQKIAAGQINTKWFARSDLHWTDFIEIPKQDILKMNEFNEKGFNNIIKQFSGTTYRNGTYIPSGWTVSTACPLDGGKVNGDPNNTADTKTYFYKGFGEANCIEYIISLGLI